ncbi:hypothetical protein AB1Y20_017163 [Prymnesium parvum]|uniref:Uncharacterized protein n=1 Tax=Prymnesium parvum TaxID=97485 RepID=A0AB34ICJ7_PRYPA
MAPLLLATSPPAQRSSDGAAPPSLRLPPPAASTRAASKAARLRKVKRRFRLEITPQTVEWAVRFAECVHLHPDRASAHLRCSRIAAQDMHKGDEQISSFIKRLDEAAD